MLRESFRLFAIVGDELTEVAPPPASDLLTMLSESRIRGEACIHPKVEHFPRANVTFHGGHGFVVQCYEHERSWSDFLVSNPSVSAPRVRIELGGLATELWPPELFIPEAVAKEALEFFLETGRQKPSLHWVRTDRFPREVIWEVGTADADQATRQ